jgi:hypothetical protein
VKGPARVRLESAWHDWHSQKQSDLVIYAKADALRSALEEATRLGEVTDEEASLYRDILESAPPGEAPLEAVTCQRVTFDAGTTLRPLRLR